MRIEFPYPGYEQIASAQVPDANLMGIYEPQAIGEIDEEDVLARASKRNVLAFATQDQQEALKMAFARQGNEATVAVLRHGGHILPLIHQKAAHGASNN